MITEYVCLLLYVYILLTEHKLNIFFSCKEIKTSRKTFWDVWYTLYSKLLYLWRSLVNRYYCRWLYLTKALIVEIAPKNLPPFDCKKRNHRLLYQWANTNIHKTQRFLELKKIIKIKIAEMKSSVWNSQICENNIFIYPFILGQYFLFSIWNLCYVLLLMSTIFSEKEKVVICTSTI
jgi:hypothetical protein